MGEGTYRTMYPTGCTARKFYELPKIQKKGTPQANCIQQGLSYLWGAKVLAKVLKSLVGKSQHHIQSSMDFVSRVREVTPLPGGASTHMMSQHCSPLYP